MTKKMLNSFRENRNFFSIYNSIILIDNFDNNNTKKITEFLIFKIFKILKF